MESMSYIQFDIYHRVDDNHVVVYVEDYHNLGAPARVVRIPKASIIDMTVYTENCIGITMPYSTAQKLQLMGNSGVA